MRPHEDHLRIVGIAFIAACVTGVPAFLFVPLWAASLWAALIYASIPFLLMFVVATANGYAAAREAQRDTRISDRTAAPPRPSPPDSP
jgi:hypothetical protein